MRTVENRVEQIATPKSEIIYGDHINLPNGITAMPVGVDSWDENFWNDNGAEFDTAMAAHDFIGIEVDPIAAKPYAIEQWLDKQNPFLSEFFDRVWTEGKPLIYTNPVSNKLRYADLGKTVLGVGAAMITGAAVANDGIRTTRRLMTINLALLGISIPMVATSEVGRRLLEIPLTPVRHKRPLLTHNRFNLNEYKTAGMVAGLRQAASEGVIHGSGMYIVDDGIINDVVHFGSDVEEAEAVYKKNMHHRSQDSFPPEPIRIWSPSERTNTFSLTYTLDRAI